MIIIRKLLGRLSSRRFDIALVVCARRAQRLYDKKGNTVVCSYCGGLLPKKEAGMMYDIESRCAEYHHEACFQKYEKHGTIEDLIRMGEQERNAKSKPGGEV